jgi:uncharacterized membrane protein
VTAVTRWPRILGILFVVSLGVNLFLGGWVAAQWLAPHRSPPGRMLDRLAERLPPADAAILRATLKPEPAMRERMHELHRRVGALLRAQPFDADALAAAFAEDLASRGGFGRDFARAAANMSPEGRLKLADEQERMP